MNGCSYEKDGRKPVARLLSPPSYLADSKVLVAEVSFWEAHGQLALVLLDAGGGRLGGAAPYTRGLWMPVYCILYSG